MSIYTARPFPFLPKFSSPSQNFFKNLRGIDRTFRCYSFLNQQSQTHLSLPFVNMAHSLGPTGGTPTSALVQALMRAIITPAHNRPEIAIATIPVTIPTWPQKIAPTIPTYELTKEDFLKWLGSLCPLGTDVETLVKQHMGQSFITDYDPENFYILWHRAFQGFFGAKGAVAEMSQAGLEAPYAIGAKSTETDPTYLRDKQEIAAHDYSLNRNIPEITGGYGTHNWDNIKKLRLVFKPVNADGQETGEVYQSEYGPTTMKSFLNDVVLCHDDREAFYDTRDRDAGTKIAGHVLMIMNHKNPKMRRTLLKNFSFQAYPHGYPLGGQDLLDDIIAKIKEDMDADDFEDRKEQIMELIKQIPLSPVMPHNGFKRVVPLVADVNDPHMRESSGTWWMESFHEVGLNVRVHHIPPRGDDEWMDDDFNLDEAKFMAKFEREPKPRDIMDLQNDKILHKLVRKFKEEYPGIPILITSKALTTSVTEANGEKVYIRHLFRDAHARVLKPKVNMEDYLYIEHTRPGAARRRGANIVLTDRPVHELALVAHDKKGTTPPDEATDVDYYPLSQEAFEETLKAFNLKN